MEFVSAISMQMSSSDPEHYVPKLKTPKHTGSHGVRTLLSEWFVSLWCLMTIISWFRDSPHSGPTPVHRWDES